MQNWAGNLTYAARRRHEPRSLDELVRVVRGTDRIRVIGTGHSFNGLADTTGDHLSLAELVGRIAIDHDAPTIRVHGGQRYADICPALESVGLALANLASLPHISIAGACATATHGSGVGNGNLATSVSAIEIVLADGEVRRLDRAVDKDAFAGAVVGLGALGVVTGLTLDVEPTYGVRQDVYEDLSFDAFEEHREAVLGAAHSVSLFTDWTTPSFHQVWLKTRLSPGDVDPGVPAELFGARAAEREMHPIRGFAADPCTPQLGRPGPWHERLPHFRAGNRPSAGNELQSEYFVPRHDIATAVRAVAGMASELAPLVLVSEIRTIAADDFWLSPAYRRPSAAIHFTWRPDQPAVLGLLPRLEQVLEPFAPRPHWGKLFSLGPEALAGAYVRMPGFVKLARQLDPRGKFRNEFVDRYIFGAA